MTRTFTIGSIIWILLFGWGMWVLAQHVSGANHDAPIDSNKQTASSELPLERRILEDTHSEDFREKTQIVVSAFGSWLTSCLKTTYKDKHTKPRLSCSVLPWNGKLNRDKPQRLTLRYEIQLFKSTQRIALVARQKKSGTPLKFGCGSNMWIKNADAGMEIRGKMAADFIRAALTNDCEMNLILEGKHEAETFQFSNRGFDLAMRHARKFISGR